VLRERTFQLRQLVKCSNIYALPWFSSLVLDLTFARSPPFFIPQIINVLYSRSTQKAPTWYAFHLLLANPPTRLLCAFENRTGRSLSNTQRLSHGRHAVSFKVHIHGSRNRSIFGTLCTTTVFLLRQRMRMTGFMQRNIVRFSRVI
jgi:hypothetical protein